MPKLMDVVFTEFKKPIDVESSLVQARYKRFIEELRDDLKTYSSMPISYAIQDRNRILQKGSRSNEEYLAVLDDLKLEHVNDVLKNQTLDKKMQYTSMIMGNIDFQHAEMNDKRFLHEMKGVDTTLPLKDVELVTPVVNPQVPIEIRKTNPREGDPNHVTVVSLLKGIPNIADRVLHHINGQILGNLAFDELRTKRQLGYVVNAGVIQLSNVMGVSAVVQGSVMKPDDVEPLIEWLYHVKMVETLKNMTDSQFEQYKSSFAEELTEPPLGFSDEIGYYWGPVLNGGQCFDLKLEMIRYANTQLKSKQQLLEAWDQMLEPSDTGVRKKVVVKYFSGKVPPRPSADDTTKAFSEAGLPSELVQTEYKSALLFDKAESSTRLQILVDSETRAGKGKGYFSEDLGCSKASSAANDAVALLANAETALSHPQATLMKHSRPVHRHEY
jgi:secreted Zn-dependent insulinase-like peptidase